MYDIQHQEATTELQASDLRQAHTACDGFEHISRPRRDSGITAQH